ncbi:hypothetical protein SAMN05192569_10922 [Parageobacillus thermantarcticus]|uniref:Uncharacterized protein n=1 Tax=Parageobacillus thermantarcticus TaxID=186116 RepID=A0A1I0U0C6_9BACL|nr:hypothetical protein SAMN05192569_10922 [Parageobacillus thermantarcticus]
MNIFIFILIQFFLHLLVYYSIYVVSKLEKARLSCKMEKFGSCFIIFLVFLFHMIVLCKYPHSILFEYNLIGIWMLSSNLLFYYYLQKIVRQ